MTDLYDYHNGPNLGLEPTTPRQVGGEYLTLIFKKPISQAVSAIFAAQEWVAASHYDALQERDNYAREVAELRAENKRLREELSKMRGVEPSDKDRVKLRELILRYGGARNIQGWYEAKGDYEEFLRRSNEAYHRAKDIEDFFRALLARYGAQPAAGEEIMVNTTYDVFTLPLQPSGLSSGPRFVVHVPGPEQPAAVDEAMVKRFLEAFQNTPGDEAIDADEKVARRWLTAAIDAAMSKEGRGDE